MSDDRGSNPALLLKRRRDLVLELGEGVDERVFMLYRSVQACIEAVAKDGFEVMIASHNKTSIERAVLLMEHFNLSPPSLQNVYFGQLLGMADPITFVLGRRGYRVSPPS